jgi:hypothetical protein
MRLGARFFPGQLMCKINQLAHRSIGNPVSDSSYEQPGSAKTDLTRQYNSSGAWGQERPGNAVDTRAGSVPGDDGRSRRICLGGL